MEKKNIIRIVIAASMVLLLLFSLYKCKEIKELKSENQRISNNYEASQAKINQYKLDENTWVSEKLIYNLTFEELKSNYSDLLGEYKLEKNRKPYSIVNSELVIREEIKEIPIEIKNEVAYFKDFKEYDDYNFRNIDGAVDIKNRTADIDLEIGVALRLITDVNEKDNKVSVQVLTDYPGITFTKLDGAIIDFKPTSKVSERRTFGIGLSVGYGAVMGPQIKLGPYIGIGLNYTPKFLQFGKK